MLTNPFEKLSPESGLILYALALSAIAAAMCGLLLRLLLKTGWAWRLAVDHPNERSLHTGVVPRCGGWGVMATIFLVVGATSPALWRLLSALFLLVLVSFLDDRRGLPVATRFLCQFAALALVLVGSTAGLPGWEIASVALLWLWMTNLFNFMDGADGLAGSMAVIGFGSYAIASGFVNIDLTTMATVAAGSAVGFLLFNRPPARIFLGDAGSIPLGFLAAAVGFLGWRNGRWPFWFPLLVFSPFVSDASVTILKRLLRGERIWLAHREHYYQRLIQAGGTHGQVTALWAVAMIIAASLALVLLHSEAKWQPVGIGIWCLTLFGLGFWIDRRWARFRLTHTRGDTPS